MRNTRHQTGDGSYTLYVAPPAPTRTTPQPTTTFYPPPPPPTAPVYTQQPAPVYIPTPVYIPAPPPPVYIPAPPPPVYIVPPPKAPTPPPPPSVCSAPPPTTDIISIDDDGNDDKYLPITSSCNKSQIMEIRKSMTFIAKHKNIFTLDKCIEVILGMRLKRDDVKAELVKYILKTYYNLAMENKLDCIGPASTTTTDTQTPLHAPLDIQEFDDVPNDTTKRSNEHSRDWCSALTQPTTPVNKTTDKRLEQHEQELCDLFIDLFGEYP